MRRSQLDNTGRTVRNLFTNPSCETNGSAITTRLNLALDPSATAISRWSVIGSLAMTRTVDSTVFHEGSTAIRYTSTATGQPGAKNQISGGVTSGDTVAWSVWVYSSVAVTLRPYWERTSPTYVGGSGGTTFDVVANTWTKISFAYLFNATQADPAGSFGFGFLATTNFNSGDYIVCDEILVEKSTVVGTWFSGATASGNDFTYAWAGTVNDSASNQKSFYMAGVSSQNCFVITSTDWSLNGTKSARVIPGLTSSTDTSLNLNVTLENKTYTLLATCRVKAPQTGTPDATRARRIQLFYTGTGASQSAQAPNAVGIYPLSVTFKVTDYTQYNSLRLYNGASAGNGDIWWDNIMLVEGAYSGDYVDGTKAFSKWDGTAHASTSVGYPQQLTDIAGKPFTDVSGVFNTGTLAVSAFSPRTIYVCYENVASAINYPMYVSYGVANSKGLNVQASAIGGPALSPRFDFVGGDTNKTPSGFTTGRSIQRHVAAFALNSGLTSMASCLDGNADVVTAFTPGSTGWDDGRVDARTTTDGSNIRTLVYYAEHDRATRVAISRYLGNKYGAFVA